MLPLHIIEELRRREEHSRADRQKRLQLPLPGADPSKPQRQPAKDDTEPQPGSDRGVWICDLLG